MTREQTTFVLIDTETSHRDAAQAEVVEVAAMIVDGGMWPAGDEAIFQSVVFNERPLSAEVSAIHGLMDRDLANAPRIDEVECRLLDFIPPRAIVVAHNGAEYDFPLLRRTMPSAFPPIRATVCSERLARQLDPTAPNYKLASLRYRYGHDRIDTQGAAHRALSDVLVLRYVFGSLLDRFGAADSVMFTDRLIALSEAPIWIQRFPFGKYRDEPIADCTDASYIMWCLGNMDLRPDMRWTLEQRFEQIVALIDRFGRLTALGNDRNATDWHREVLRARYRQLQERAA